MILRIALRNILRNGRRSVMTLLAIAVGGIAVVLFGEFIAFVQVSLETNAVENVGHLTVFRKGYFDYGAGIPGAFGIDDYEDVIRTIADDPVIRPTLNVVTPTISMSGIAGNFAIDASKTFLGTGYVPADREKLRRWDARGVTTGRVLPDPGLSAEDESRGVVGVGLARVLGLCRDLQIANCPPRPEPPVRNASTPSVAPPSIASDPELDTDAHSRGPRLDLLAATANGAPNVMSLYVTRAEPQGARELDENVVLMSFSLAQKLLYGRGEKKATGIILQLRRTDDLAKVRARLTELFAARHLDLEVRDFAEREPFYRQAVGMFGAIFLFIAMIMGVIVLFTVVNTIGMSVAERTNEIGTIRAMGVRRGGVRRLFVVEGAMLGFFGATLGIASGQILAILFNRAGATWTPPGQAAPVPLSVLTSGVNGLLVFGWVGLVMMATIAAVVPANRAARLEVVDALRHV
jgi:putative ABC transport system permease protein